MTFGFKKHKCPIKYDSNILLLICMLFSLNVNGGYFDSQDERRVYLSDSSFKMNVLIGIASLDPKKIIKQQEYHRGTINTVELSEECFSALYPGVICQRTWANLKAGCCGVKSKGTEVEMIFDYTPSDSDDDFTDFQFKGSLVAGCAMREVKLDKDGECMFPLTSINRLSAWMKALTSKRKIVTIQHPAKNAYRNSS